MITVEFCGVPSPPHPECNSIFRTDLVVDWPDTISVSAQIINIAIQTCFIRRLDTDKSLLAPNGAFSAKVARPYKSAQWFTNSAVDWSPNPRTRGDVPFTPASVKALRPLRGAQNRAVLTDASAPGEALI
jgi:hypothetical protein